MSDPHMIEKGMWYCCKIGDFRSWQIFCKILIWKKVLFSKGKEGFKNDWESDKNQTEKCQGWKTEQWK